MSNRPIATIALLLLASASAHAQTAPPPEKVVKKPFVCTAPISNLQRKRDPAEVTACLSAHALSYAGVFHTFRAMGVNPGKGVTFYVTVSPRGSVARWTAGSDGPVDTKMIDVIGTVIQKISLGICDPCQSETVPYSITFTR